MSSVISRLDEFNDWLDGYGPVPDWFCTYSERPGRLPEDWNPNAPDPEWVATLPHSVVEYDSKRIPAYEGDTERIEWERTHDFSR